MSTTDQSPKPKLHWLRYKLKTLLLVVLPSYSVFARWVQNATGKGVATKEKASFLTASGFPPVVDPKE